MAAINDENLSNYTRKQRLAELKELIPDYNAELNEEGRLINNNKEAIDQYLVSLEKQIKLKAYQEELEELYKKKGILKARNQSKATLTGTPASKIHCQDITGTVLPLK